MKKRIIAAILAAVVVLSMCTPFSLAVTPADPLIASALYSFVLSAGIKLFRDGGIDGSDELVEDMKALYSRYKTEQGSYSDWEMLGQGITYNAGNYIYTRDTALTLQSFTNWLGEKIGNTPNAQSIIIERLPQPNYGDHYTTDVNSGLTQLNNGVWTQPVFVLSQNSCDVYDSETGIEEGEPNASYVVVSSSQPVYIIYGANGNIGEGKSFLEFCSLGTFNITKYNFDYSTDENGDRIQTIRSTRDYTSTKVSLYNTYVTNDGNKFTLYRNNFSGGVYLEYEAPNYISDWSKEASCADEMAYVTLAGDREEQPALPGGSIIGKLSNAILDVAHNIADQGALAIDIGASAATTQEEATDIVVGDYGQTESIAIPAAVATPIPAEGVSELYPQPSDTDVEDLGLPELGQALTNRFPFCIPFDVASAFRSLNATAVCPVIEVDLFPASFKNRIGITGDTSFTINFGDQKYSLFIKLIHWGALTSFILMLAYATKRLIWTSGG